MRRARLALALACRVVLATLATACVHPYKFPTADQPHATLKLRRVYERVAGTRLDERCLIDDHLALSETVASEVAQAPRADGMLVHPRVSRLKMTGSFVHQEVRTVQESYTVQVPYTDTEFYSCGTGTSFQTCTRMVTRYRTETRYRWVTKPVDVVDGTCAGDLVLAAQVDHVYLVDFTYRDNGVCSVVCVEQLSSGSGTFENRPCPVPPAQ